MSGVIPKDKLTGYKRWDIGSLDAKQKPAVQNEPPVAKTSTVVAASAALPDLAETIAPQPLTSAEELERMHAEARAEGYAIGFREGQEAGQQSMAMMVAESTARYAELLGNLQLALDDLDQHVADQVLGVALEVAAQVLRGAINTRSELLLPVIREAIAALPLHHAHVVLRMNPMDAPLIREQIGEQLAQTGTQIIDDPEVSIGGCQLVAGASEVDATIETRWKRVLESIGVAPLEWMNQP